MNIRRCQFVKVKSLPLEIESFYDDLQNDYKKMMQFLIAGSGLGHLVWENDVARTIEAGEQTHAVIGAFASGGKGAENCYGLFYKNYKPLARRTKKSKEYKFFTNLNNAEYFAEKASKLKSFSEEELQVYRNRHQNGESVEILWHEASSALGSRAGKLLAGADKVFPAVARPNDIEYCKALAFMLASSFSSWVQCHANHLAETANLQEKLKSKQLECGRAYNCLLSFSDSLESRGYGLSKKVLKKILTYARERIEPEAFFTIPFSELANHPELLSFDDKAIFSAYYAVKLHWRLRNRRKYISMPRLTDYQVPFGMTGRGYKFDMSNNGHLAFQIKGHNIECFNSSYFSDLQVVKNGNTFLIKFRHKLKDAKKEVYKDWLNAKLNEIKLLRRNGEFYIYLPYTIEHKETNFDIAKQFQKADFSAVPPTRVAGFDLNLNIPITVTYADWDGKECKNVKSEILCNETSLSGQLRSLVNEFKELLKVLRNYKSAVKNKVDLDKESAEWLGSLLTVPYGNYRHQIQLVMAKLNKRKKQLAYRCRKNGHRNLSENIQLLRLIDVSRSLRQAFINIHIYDNSKYIHAVFDVKRMNFRRFVSRQFGAVIAGFAIKHSIGVAFREDLDIQGDFDNDRNDLGRLFASGQLCKHIDEALEKVGVACVAVPPDGTSRTDPVTGYVGYRDALNKTCLYVLRDGQIGKIHADIAASLNVLLRGCNHSVYPYKMYLKKGKLCRNGKRVDAFLSKRQLPDFGKYTGYVYVTPNGFWTKNQRDQWVEQIKDQSQAGHPVPDFAINGNSINSYNAFKVVEVLESTEVLGDQAVAFAQQIAIVPG